MTFEKFATVIVDLAIHKELEYGIPTELIPRIKKGMRVEVPVKNRPTIGYILAIKDQPNFLPVKPISKIASEDTILNEELFELALWMSSYYSAPLQQVIKVILPASVRKNQKHKEQLFVRRLKTREELQIICKDLRNKQSVQATILDEMLKVTKGYFLSELIELAGCSSSSIKTLCKRGLLAIEKVKVDRSPLENAEYFKTTPKELNSDQATSLKEISKSLEANQYASHLLHGITGSGKTEVYLQAIEFAKKLGKSTIMLVPEVSLTAQTIERFRSRFEGHIAVLHHRLSLGERLDEWERVRLGKAQIVIGARSAVFSPVKNLGLIIVDEEHETSYKQTEEAPCYHARDIAVMRASQMGATVVLGSATPSLESYYNTHLKKYHLTKLTTRPNFANLPKVHIIDMQKECEKQKRYTNFSDPLLEGIKKRLETAEQSILFLNRRGYHTTLFCPTCKKTIQCPHCDISLTFHLNEKTLACHMCGFTLRPPPIHCPYCKTSVPMKFRGVGTEQIERALHAIFKEIRTIRLDADTTRHKGSHEKLLRQFATGKADVLIGTQMVAKGLHFSQVTLVGVINCDSGLQIPDFRASESTFQLITQVAGRAGRGFLPGEVIIQTFIPENRTIQLAASQDYETFYCEEIETRKLFQYPPFIKMVKLTFSGKKADETNMAALKVHAFLKKELPAPYLVHPVIAAGHAKIKDYYRYQCLIRGPSTAPITQLLNSIKDKLSISSKIKLLIDVNPTSTFF